MAMFGHEVSILFTLMIGEKKCGSVGPTVEMPLF